jgi:hypothetical protein
MEFFEYSEDQFKEALSKIAKGTDQFMGATVHNMCIPDARTLIKKLASTSISEDKMNVLMVYLDNYEKLQKKNPDMNIKLNVSVFNLEGKPKLLVAVV